VSGALPAWRMIPTWALQAMLLTLFASAYHHPIRSLGTTATV
jgi:hypothetical protein